MRLLCLLRHAKSSWDDPGLADFDRPLAPRGRAAAPRIGAWIAAQGLCPDVVLCSPALRTRQTWELVAPACGGSARVDHRRSIYEAPPAHLSAALAGVSSSRSEEHTSELQSLMRISYAVFCLNKKTTTNSSK